MSFIFRNPPLFVASLGLGLVSNSYFLFTNIGASSFGIVPAISAGRSKAGKKLVSTEKGVELFGWYYDAGAPAFIKSALVTSASFLVAAQVLPAHATSDISGLNLKVLLYAASFLVFGTLPYTKIIMMGTYQHMLALRDRVALNSETLDTATEEEVASRIKVWKKQHIPRIVAGAVALVMGYVVAATV